MSKLKTFLQTKPVYLYLLPVFFVLHGFTENFFLIPVKDALLLITKYLTTSLLLSLVFWAIYRNFHKANLAAFLIIAFNFFFGSVFDVLKSNFANTFVVKYSFILSVSALLLFAFFIYFKKTKKTFIPVTKYLNLLFLLLLFLDSSILLFKLSQKTEATSIANTTKVTVCDTCAKPDIYLIITDEYAGTEELRDIFHFDNSLFENNLSERGFHLVKGPKSNYNWTIYSMASLLNMTYLNHLSSDNIVNNNDEFFCTDLIKNNFLTRFLKKNGYEVFNYSFFNIADKPISITPVFIPTRKALITSQTFTSHALKDIGFNFFTSLGVSNSIDIHMNNNEKVDSMVKMEVLLKNKPPKFIYAHFVMPHLPYYFDRNLKKMEYKSDSNPDKRSKKSYLEYLLYTNRKLL